MAVFVQVYNSAMKETVSWEKINPDSLRDALEYKRQLEREFQQGCHEVHLFVELWPETEDEDIEDEFDADEMEEEE